jgi:hypothetical protein
VTVRAHVLHAAVILAGAIAGVTIAVLFLMK